MSQGAWGVGDATYRGSGSKRCFIVLVVVLVLAIIGLAVALGIFVTKYNDEKDQTTDGSSLEKIQADQKLMMQELQHIAEHIDEQEEREKDEATSLNSGEFRYSAVASGAKICSTIGSEIMVVHGGTAIDGAIASLFCVGVVHAHNFGLGGGFLATIYAKRKNSNEKEVRSLNCREVAPLSATQDMYVNKSTGDLRPSLIGGQAIGVPGEVKGYHDMWKEYGVLSWSSLVQPTIDLCENGFEINKYMAYIIKSKDKIIKLNDNLRNIYTDDEGHPLKEGDVLKRPKLAETLRTIRNDPEAFYKGQLAQDIVDDIAECDGEESYVTLNDLKQYTSVWKEPVKTSLQNGGYTIYSPPPPSSGIIVQFILNILDEFNFDKSDYETEEGRALLYHKITEAFKFGYGKRSLLGDEDFVDITEWRAKLVSDEFAAEIKARINLTHTQNLEYYKPAFLNNQDAGTNHFSLVAPDGSAVAITSTINTYFGSTCTGTRTGIIFNNEMDDFSTPGVINAYGFSPSESNFIAPGKRPMSSMSPSLVLNNKDEVVQVVGSTGGSRIITSIILTAIDMLWLEKTTAESDSTARFHHQLMPNKLMYDPWMPESLLTKMEGYGHVVESWPERESGCNHLFRKCPNGAEESERPMCVQATCDTRFLHGCKPDGV